MLAQIFLGAGGGRVLHIFGSVDGDGSGRINLEEFSQCVGQLCTVEDGDMQILFDVVDRDGDGLIDYEEFVTFLAGPRAAKKIMGAGLYNRKKEAEALPEIVQKSSALLRANPIKPNAKAEQLRSYQRQNVIQQASSSTMHSLIPNFANCGKRRKAFTTWLQQNSVKI